MADERIDLRERERDRRPPLEVLADEAIGGSADVEGHLRGVLDDGDAMLLGEREDAEELTHALCGALRVDVTADGADRRAGTRIFSRSS